MRLVANLYSFFGYSRQRATRVHFLADMAELADAPDLGSGVPDVQVQVLLSASCVSRLMHEQPPLRFALFAFRKVCRVGGKDELYFAL